MAQETDSAHTRQTEGCRAGMAGLAGNLLLAGGKLAVGMVSNSIAVMADAFNNAADAFSSLVTLVGFKLSGKAGDEKHPYGYGRMEYVSGFVVALVILVTALSLGKAAVWRLLDPAPVETAPLFGAVLLASVAVKLGLAWYTFGLNRRLDSSALRAAVTDNVADAAVTGVTLAGMLLNSHTTFPVDACTGLLVVALLLYSGWRALWENLDFLLGRGAGERLTEQVRAAVLAHGEFAAVLSFDMHDYGPNARMAALRVTVRETVGSGEAERALREVTETLRREYGIEAGVYVEPASATGVPPRPVRREKEEDASADGPDVSESLWTVADIHRNRWKARRQALRAVLVGHFLHCGIRPDTGHVRPVAARTSGLWREHSSRG